MSLRCGFVGWSPTQPRRRRSDAAPLVPVAVRPAPPPDATADGPRGRGRGRGCGGPPSRPPPLPPPKPLGRLDAAQVQVQARALAEAQEQEQEQQDEEWSRQQRERELWEQREREQRERRQREQEQRDRERRGREQEQRDAERRERERREREQRERRGREVVGSLCKARSLLTGIETAQRQLCESRDSALLELDSCHARVVEVLKQRHDTQAIQIRDFSLRKGIGHYLTYCALTIKKHKTENELQSRKAFLEALIATLEKEQQNLQGELGLEERGMEPLPSVESIEQCFTPAVNFVPTLFEELCNQSKNCGNILEVTREDFNWTWRTEQLLQVSEGVEEITTQLKTPVFLSIIQHLPKSVLTCLQNTTISSAFQRTPQQPLTIELWHQKEGPAQEQRDLEQASPEICDCEITSIPKPLNSDVMYQWEAKLIPKKEGHFEMNILSGNNPVNKHPIKLVVYQKVLAPVDVHITEGPILKWAPSPHGADPTSFVIQASTNPNHGDWADIHRSPDASYFFNLPGEYLSEGGDVYFRVAALRDSTASPWSSPAVFRWLPPINMRIETFPILTWEQPQGSCPPLTYILQQKLHHSASSQWTEMEHSHSMTLHDISTLVRGFSPGTSFDFRVASQCVRGCELPDKWTYLENVAAPFSWDPASCRNVVLHDEKQTAVAQDESAVWSNEVIQPGTVAVARLRVVSRHRKCSNLGFGIAGPRLTTNSKGRMLPAPQGSFCKSKGFWGFNLYSKLTAHVNGIPQNPGGDSVGCEVADGSVVQMTVDFTDPRNGTLRFSVDGIDKGVLCSGIQSPPGSVFRVAFSACCQEHTVTLV
ncbi:hypothetical protein Pelo_1511 [Pelomyxa schiedti]|nr:hypothetical protein Pelo_1511 [Pelomyxa schiedti]